MDEIRDSRRGKMTMRQLNSGNKNEVLRKLQESSNIHFEKVLPASSVQQKGESRLTLPVRFVREHGGKLQKHVVLRSQSSLAYSWTVSLSIEHNTAASALVRFRAGWRAFVSFNGLLEGDTLVLSLTAMSEFEVYIFREDSGSPKEFPSLSLRERSNDSELARKKARPSPERRDEQFVADDEIKGLAKSNSLIAKKKIVGLSEEFPAFTSNQSPPSFHLSSYSNDLHLLESENNRDCSSGGRPNLRSDREPAIGHDRFDMMPGVDTKGDPARQFDFRMKKENEDQDSALANTGRNRQLPRFLKKLAVSSIHLPERGSSAACVEETKFRKRYSSRLQSVDKLQANREDSKASNVLHSSKGIFENDLQQSKMHLGKAFFEKKLATSSLPPRSAMTLPKLFVQQHGDKIQKYITLRNVANGKMWTVKINITFSHNQPQTYFYRGWRDFTAGNDLVIGDRLTFVLVAKSLFHVFILRIGVNPGLSMQKPNLWSHNPSPAQRETKMSPGPQHGCKSSADGCQKSENPLSGTLLAKNTAVSETYVAKVAASDSPDSSQSPSDMDSHYFEPTIQQMELECVSKAVNNSAVLEQDQSKLPYFLKRTTMSSTLEIPVSFLTKNYTRLGTRVQLQGIHEDSPEWTVDCCSVNTMGRLRVFFRNGWSQFVNENALPVGQRLVFTLTADSFFVVRNV